jgi:hypothetical protein
MAPEEQALINRDLLTALSDDEKPPPEKLWHPYQPLREWREAHNKSRHLVREGSWLSKDWQRKRVASAKRAANREAKRREGKMKTL